MSFQVSNPDKVIFAAAGLTKSDLVAYYERAAEKMLPHLAGRPLTLQRFPNGIEKKGFMQKNASDHFPAELIGRIPIEHSERTTHYPTVSSVEGLAYLANQGTVSFHIWTSREPHLDRPDRIIFDLDPPAGEHAAAREAALRVREALDELSLPSCPLVTGSKGYHVMCPVTPDHDVDTLAAFTQRLSERLTTQHPDTLTSEFRKNKRKGRVFVDWLRNRQAQTVVAPWSLRPTKAATVAVPILWDEIEETAPDAFTLETVGERFDTADPFFALDPCDLSDAIAEIGRAGDDS